MMSVQDQDRKHRWAPISLEAGPTVCAHDHEGRALARLIYGSIEEARRSMLDLRERIMGLKDEEALLLAVSDWVSAEEKRSSTTVGGKHRPSFLDRFLGVKDPQGPEGDA